MQRTRTIAMAAWLSLTPIVPPVEAHATPPAAPSSAPVRTIRREPPDPSQRAPARPSEADYPTVALLEGATVYSVDPQLVEDVAWALERFRSAGLALPPVEVWTHTGPAGCMGADGIARHGYLAGTAEKWVVFHCAGRFVLLHELAHVWDHHVVTDDVRAAFLELRGLEHWGGVPRERAGGEHLADVVAWGLHEDHPRPLRSAPRDDASLAAAFALATDPFRGRIPAASNYPGGATLIRP